MANDLASMGSGLVSGAMDIGLLIGVFIITVGLSVGIIFFIRSLQKYNQFKCIVFSRDGAGQLYFNRDKAGVFLDPKTNNKMFYLKKGRTGIPCKDIPFIFGPKGERLVFLYKAGTRSFRFIRDWKIGENGVTVTVDEEDVNWGVNEYQKQKKVLLGNKELIIAIVIFAVIAILILVMMIVFSKSWSELQQKSAEFLAQAAIEFAKASQDLKEIASGTIVRAGG